MTEISPRKMIDSPVGQAEGEWIAYKFDTAVWGTTTPSAVVVYVFESGTQDTSNHTNGALGISGTVITTPRITNIIPGRRYRLVVQWTDQNGNIMSAFCEIIGEKA